MLVTPLEPFSDGESADPRICLPVGLSWFVWGQQWWRARGAGFGCRHVSDGVSQTGFQVGDQRRAFGFDGFPDADGGVDDRPLPQFEII